MESSSRVTSKLIRLAAGFGAGLLVWTGACYGPSPDEEGDDETDASLRDGGDTTSHRDTGPGTDTPDREVGADTRMPPKDSTGGETTGDTVAGCGGRQCGTNAECVSGTCECESGYTGDPYTKCEEEMQGSCSNRSDCGTFAVCISGSCKCDPGFIPKSGSSGCTRPSVGEPKNRTKSQVCQRWNKVSSGITRNIWKKQPQNTCDTGKLKPKVHWEAMRATNGYRWLIGLDPAASDGGYMSTNQECATMMAANNQLSHNPPTNWQCYTQKGANGAGSSNIAMGPGHPAPTVRQYIDDSGNYSTMGHRRWIFSPGLGRTGFGHRGRYGCMYTIDGSGPDAQKEIRFPSRGPFPEGALAGPWSYFHTQISSFGSAKVTVTNVQSGNKLTVSDVESPQGTYGRIEGVVWRVSGARAGATYRIEISDFGSSGSKSTSYETTLVQCP